VAEQDGHGGDSVLLAIELFCPNLVVHFLGERRNKTNGGKCNTAAFVTRAQRRIGVPSLGINAHGCDW